MNGAPLVTTYVSGTHLIAAIKLPSPPATDTSFIVLNPNPGLLASNSLLVPPATACDPVKATDAAARRFLEQAAFGPDPYSVCRVKTLGIPGWINGQRIEVSGGMFL